MTEYTNQKPIAILLGVYNAEKYIATQIDSILNQTHTDWTLYVRNDASNDNTLNILKNYAKTHPNIILCQDDDGNLGCNGNYYRLLSIVSSQYYMFCNADDFWLNFKIKISVDYFKNIEKSIAKQPIIVHTDLSISDEKLNITTNSYWEETNTNPENFKTFNKLGICSVVAGATMFFNDAVKKVTFPVPKDGPFFDQWMALQVSKNGKIYTIHEPTIVYRQIGTNLAAVAKPENDTLFYKINNLSKVFEINKKEAAMLKKIAWGGLAKYIYYKAIVLFSLRFGKKYHQINYKKM